MREFVHITHRHGLRRIGGAGAADAPAAVELAMIGSASARMRSLGTSDDGVQDSSVAIRYMSARVSTIESVSDMMRPW